MGTVVENREVKGGDAMRTCDCCGREHKGDGSICGRCNPKLRIKNCGGHRSMSQDHIEAMEYAELKEADNDDGWPYDDEEDGK